MAQIHKKLVSTLAIVSSIYYLIQYCDKEMKHKVVKKKWDTLVLVVFSQCRQVAGGLINTTSSCLHFKICANKIDLKSLKVLILESL